MTSGHVVFGYGLGSCRQQGHWRHLHLPRRRQEKKMGAGSPESLTLWSWLSHRVPLPLLLSSGDNLLAFWIHLHAGFTSWAEDCLISSYLSSVFIHFPVWEARCGCIDWGFFLLKFDPWLKLSWWLVLQARCFLNLEKTKTSLKCVRYALIKEASLYSMHENGFFLCNEAMEQSAW